MSEGSVGGHARDDGARDDDQVLGRRDGIRCCGLAPALVWHWCWTPLNDIIRVVDPLLGPADLGDRRRSLELRSARGRWQCEAAAAGATHWAAGTRHVYRCTGFASGQGSGLGGGIRGGCRDFGPVGVMAAAKIGRGRTRSRRQALMRRRLPFGSQFQVTDAVMRPFG
jgi:hypothetical protein